MTVITVGIIQLKLKDVKIEKNGTSKSGLHITYKGATRKEIHLPNS